MTDVALVTGANSGIGYEVVRALARKGMIVYLGSRDLAKGEKATDNLKGEGDIRLVRIDFDVPETLAAAVERIESEQGKLDVLVNNAGAAFHGTVFDATPEVIRRSFQTNLHGPMHLTQLAVPLLRRSGGARIVNVSSAAGQFAFLRGEKWPLPVAQLPYAYSIAKAALNAATVMWAAALKEEKIAVNACNPGYTNTQVSGFQGGKTPREGAEIIVRLATGDNGGETGKFFEADGTLMDW